jgi:hypothetical protein
MMLTGKQGAGMEKEQSDQFETKLMSRHFFLKQTNSDFLEKRSYFV